MKRALLLLSVILALAAVMPDQAEAATSNFGDRALLFGKPMSISNGGATWNVTDGSDRTDFVLGNSGTGRLYYVFNPPVNVDRIYIRSHYGFVYVVLTFTDNTQKTYSVPQTGTITDYYVDVDPQLVKKPVSRVDVYDTNNGTILYEFDLRQAIIDTAPPQVPTGVVASVSGGNATISWNPVPDEDLAGYYVYVDGVKVNSSLLTDTTYTIALQANVPVTVQVSAMDTSGNESALSNPITVIWDTIPPAKPTGLFATPQKGQILLEWISNKDDTTGYYVYRDGVRITPEPVRGTSYMVSGLEGVEYEFQVSAVDAEGNESEKSDPVRAAIPDMTPPAAPTGLKATGEVGRVKLTWNANGEPDLAGYYVYRNGVRLNSEPVKAPNYYVYGLSYGIGYIFQVSAVDTTGNESPKSEQATAAAIRPEDTTPPASPTGLTAVLGSDALHISLSWAPNKEPDLAGYNLYVSQNGIAWNKYNADPIQGTEYDYAPIQGRTTYYFRMTALDQSGNESKPSREISITTPSREPVPDVEKTPPKLIITWAPIPGAMEYLIYYQGRLHAVVPADVTQYEITLEEGYDPEAERQNVVVKARMMDGTIGFDSPGKTGEQWGFTAGDIFRNAMWVVTALAGFVLFGILFRVLPNLIGIIKNAAARRGASV